MAMRLTLRPGPVQAPEDEAAAELAVAEPVPGVIPDAR